MPDYTDLITADELAQRIRFSKHYISTSLRDSVFVEGKHYIRPFGRRNVLYIWPAIEKEMFAYRDRPHAVIPMAGGKVCRG